MKLSTLKNPTTEVFVEGHGVACTATVWSNLEGVNFMLTDEKTMAMRLSGCLQWEELDTLLVALTAARSA